MKLNEKDKAKYNKELGENTRKAQARSGKLAELGQTDQGGNRMLLRLWEELSPNSALNHFCPFCATPLPIHMLFDGQSAVEHILPYSRHFDDSAANPVPAPHSSPPQTDNQP